LLSTTLMATKAPVLFVPAMNVNMFENAAYRKNEERLVELGCHVMEPLSGYLACGWEGKGKFPDPAAVFEETLRILSPSDLAGERVLVTAGPTCEKIDPIRFVSNFSSGKMGYAVARAARNRGAKVTLVSGPTCLAPPCGVEVVPVTTANEMCDEVLKRIEEVTVVIKAAAVADYRPEKVADKKIKKEQMAEMVLRMEKNPDILSELGKIKKDRLVVGFAAETGDLVENAREKLQRKNLDLIVANDVTAEGAGFDVDTNIVRFLFPDGTMEELPQMSKAEVSEKLLDAVCRMIEKKK
ncbi:MAG TPA: bifunctional phosphopantothenoylcysteine decarboxylase/phosphopantothenate--cysteine ligase CoaBC, partial [Desulfuromonadales bacterium]|nr:bifunctional phosphopantothenoylcysteine decarboxylase/phosphopantothenate--cysteine ligase CoaBC [Desulfuromonadales bacterium]